MGLPSMGPKESEVKKFEFTGKEKSVKAEQIQNQEEKLRNHY